MKIAVIGAGIVGITTAYELARDGHDISVFERTGAAAEGASFANTGVMSTSMTLPWSVAPHSNRTALDLFRSLHGITLKKGLTRQDLHWLWSWGKPANADIQAIRKNAAHALASYSQCQLQAKEAELALEFQHSAGHLLTVPTQASHRNVAFVLASLKDNGIPFTELTPTQAIKIEPALALSDPIHCAIHLPNDRAGNCRQFALLLRTEAQKYGVKFRFDADVTEVAAHPQPSVTLRGTTTPLLFDAVAVCTGEFTDFLKRHVNIKLAMATVRGYSVSAAIREPLNAPRLSVMDIETQIVITRLGNRLRVSGGAELGGASNTHDTSTIQALFRALHRYFPGSIQYPAGTQIWKGSRILTSDGLPMVGASQSPGIWLNLAHGGNGWGNACGSARVLADLIKSKRPEIDADPYNPLRTHG